MGGKKSVAFLFLVFVCCTAVGALTKEKDAEGEDMVTKGLGFLGSVFTSVYKNAAGAFHAASNSESAEKLKAEVLSRLKQYKVEQVDEFIEIIRSVGGGMERFVEALSKMDVDTKIIYFDNVKVHPNFDQFLRKAGTAANIKQGAFTDLRTMQRRRTPLLTSIKRGAHGKNAGVLVGMISAYSTAFKEAMHLLSYSLDTAATSLEQADVRAAFSELQNFTAEVLPSVKKFLIATAECIKKFEGEKEFNLMVARLSTFKDILTNLDSSLGYFIPEKDEPLRM